MTKAITTAAVLQLVEQGKVQLDEPVSKYLPKLAKLEVLRGFDKAGKPMLSAAKTPVTLKHLLTHTSGFCYDIWDGDMFRYTTTQPSSEVPILMFEPGTRWQYGQGIDWAGRLVENLSGMSLEDYFQAKILKPLGMVDTSYFIPAVKFARLVTGYRREENGALIPSERTLPSPPKSFGGGGGIYSTAADYVRFMQMIVNKGQGILKPQTVEIMWTNQIGELTAGKMKSYRPALSSEVDIQPGHTEKWGLGFLINTTPYSGGRAAGSLAWAGFENTYFWIDPKNALCAVLLMRFLPFADQQAMGLLNDFEKAVYAK